MQRRPRTTQGDFSFGNNGNVGSGEWRGVATLLQKDLIDRGDTALLFLELNSDGKPEFGSKVASATYTYPISDTWSITGSFGYSYRRFVEFRKPANNFSFRTLQGLLQVETVLHDADNLRWTTAAAFSTNRTDSFKSGRHFPLTLGGGEDGWSHSGFLRLSTNVEASTGRCGMPTATSPRHRRRDARRTSQESRSSRHRSGEARAIGALADLSWSLSPKTNVNLRAAGQLSFSRLPGSMTFVLGSDVGLRGLPGTLISGDSGYMGLAELEWTAWKQDDQSVALIPYIGFGGIHTDFERVVLEDSIGSVD